jgi:ABC-type uncharacterized transport system involved in gliding motility auxiliary subunit
MTVNRSLLSGSSIAFLLVSFVALNGISDGIFSRFYADLTEEGLYTLSKGSRAIIDKLELPIQLKFYYSKTEGDKFPIVKMYGSRVSDLLKEYERKSGGKVTVQVYDPRPDSEEEEWADKYGITPMELPTGERVYLGLVGIGGDGLEEVIPAFNISRQEFLEYDVTKLIDSLNTGKKPVVGILSPLSIQGSKKTPTFPPNPQDQSGKPWILANQLSKLVDVKYLQFDLEAIPAEITSLMVIHPRGLTEKARFAIDQFVMRGGNIFVAVDPLCMTDSPPPDPSNPMSSLTADKSSSLNELLSPWGVSLDDKKVVTDVRLGTPVSTERGMRPESFIAWLTLSPRANVAEKIVSDQDVLTSSLENIMFAWAGAFNLTPVDGLTQEVLLRTSKDSMLLEEKDIKFSAEDPRALLKKFKSGDKSLPLAVKVSGKFKSTFKAKPEGLAEDVEFLTEAKAPGTILVFSDVDFMADPYSAVSQQFFGTEVVSLLNDNLVLASNIAENMSGSNELIQLRSRGKFTRPFTKVQEIEAGAQQKYQAEEASFQNAVNEANRRLSELQAGNQAEGKKTIMDSAMLGEIQKLRADKREAQQRLRDVRRALREDKESLGNYLFILNAFLIPLLIIGYSVTRTFKSKAKA